MSAVIALKPHPVAPITAVAEPDHSPGPPQPMLPLIQAVTDIAGDRHREIEQHATRLVRAMLEVVDNKRSVLQLAPWVSESVYDDLTERLTINVRRRVRPRPRLASLHVFVPRHGSAEIAARIVEGSRSRALALRLEQTEDVRDRLRWRCTVAEWG